MPTGRIIKTGLGDLYDQRIKIAYSQGWDPQDEGYADVYARVNITTEDLRASFTSALGQWQRKQMGANVAYDSIYQGYDVTITPATYALAFTLEKETWADDRHGILGQDLARNLAAMGQYTEQVLAAGQFNTAFTATTASPWMSGGDGQYFLDTDHPILSGGTYANKPATDVDLSVTSLQDALLRLKKCQGSRGELQGLKGELLVVSSDQMWLAREILGSPQIPYISTSTPNVVREGLKEKVWAHLTDTDAWFVRSNMAPMENGRPTGRGATTIAVWRQQPEFDRDNVLDSGDRRYKGDMRLGFGRWDWRGWDGSSGG